MDYLKCLICNEFILAEKGQTAKRRIGYHVKTKHNIKAYDYVLRYIYNNKIPLCACGCGNKTNYSKFGFNKYYQDHKNRLPLSEENRQKVVNALRLRLSKRYAPPGFTVDELKEWFNSFMFGDKSYTDLALETGCDTRTIKKYWLLNNFATQQELQIRSNYYRYRTNHSKDKNPAYVHVDPNVLDLIFKDILIKRDNKERVYIVDLIVDYNLTCSSYVLKKRLYERFGESSVRKILRINRSSEAELHYLFILRYFFGKSRVKTQFKLGSFFYDFKIDSILIEFDGEYWHKETKNRDSRKTKLAEEKGFSVYRVSYKERFDISHLVKIQELLNEVNTDKNSKENTI